MAEYLSAGWARERADEVRRRPRQELGAGALDRLTAHALPDLALDLTAVTIGFPPAEGKSAGVIEGPAVRAHVGVIGGVVAGHLPARVPWTEAYKTQRYDSAGWTFKDPDAPDDGTAWAVFCDQHLSNTGDGWRPIGNGWVVADCWLDGCRDDGIEDDWLKSGVVVDSLFSSCHMGISVREGGDSERTEPAPGLVAVYDSVLGLGMQAYTTDNTGDPPKAGSLVAGAGAGQLFKVSKFSPELRVERTILYEPWAGLNGVHGLPDRSSCADVILVWGGQGEWPGTPRPGLEITTDLTVWTRARDDWLADHGYDPAAAV